MIVGRLDAVGIFKKWCAEKSRIRCQASFATHAFGMEGIIATAENGEAILIGPSQLLQLVVKLTDEMKFNYSDAREITGDEAENYSSCLTILLEPIPDEGPIDTIAFAEITSKRPY